MARLTKSQLKGILKECLIEILREEKILSSLKESVNSAPATQTRRLPSSEGTKTKQLQNPTDYTTQQRTREQLANAGLVEQINHLANVVSVGGDSSLFADILADTAMTTYQKQHEKGVPGTVVMESYTNERLAEEVESLQEMTPDGNLKHWAQVAFAKK